MTTAVKERNTEAEALAFFKRHIAEAAGVKKQVDADYQMAKLLQQTGAIPFELSQCLIISALVNVADCIIDIESLIMGSAIHKFYMDIDDLEFKLEQQGMDCEEIKATPEWKALNETNETEMNRIYEATFRAYGEIELAEMIKNNLQEFKRIIDLDERLYCRR